LPSLVLVAVALAAVALALFVARHPLLFQFRIKLFVALFDTLVLIALAALGIALFHAIALFLPVAIALAALAIALCLRPSSPSRAHHRCRPHHRPCRRRLPSSPLLAFIAASIAVAAVTLPLSVTRHPRRRRHRPRCCRPSPSSPSHLPPLPSPSSSPATHVAQTFYSN